MRLTNRHNLPQPIVAAVANDPYDKGPADISVTGLIGPARKRRLEIDHDDEREEDVADRIWALFGQIGHGILERANTEDWTERRLFIRRHGWVISGQFDRLRIYDGDLRDWKFPSVYGTNDGPKPDWVAQLNVLSILLREAGYCVKSLGIDCILRDWQKAKAKHSSDYPQVAYRKFDIPMWPTEQTEAYITERLMAHGKAQTELPECTPEERWERPATYRLMKDVNSRATSRHATRAEAEMALREAQQKWPKAELRIEEEAAYSVRCLDDWCPAAPFCEQAKELARHQLGGAILQALKKGR